MNRYALAFEAEYIVYADGPQEAQGKLEAFLKKKVKLTSCCQLQSVDAEPVSEIIDISPINQRP
jgi:hypothetical protein